MDTVVTALIASAVGALSSWLVYRQSKEDREARLPIEKDASAVDGFAQLTGSLTADNAALRAELAQVRADMANLQTRLAQLTVGLAECEAKHDAAEEEIARLRQRWAERDA